MDRILIAELPLRCRIGVGSEERAQPQQLILDVELWLDLSAAAATDEIDATVNYSTVCDVAGEVVERRPYALLESLAGSLIEELLGQFSAVLQVSVLIRKPAALARRGAAYAAVQLTRQRPAQDRRG